MKFFLCITLCLFYQAKAELEIGQKINNGIKIIAYPKYILSSSASLEKAYVILYHHCKFDVIADSQMKIKEIFTNDKIFSTSDNVKVGMLYRDIKEKLVAGSLSIRAGWANYYVSKSGWKVAFDYKSNVIDTSKVKFFFK